uniref:Uncharacterized protein n=1 Tax=Percolomonas cosmopolitus TaxID=63605 RepID=A0A7S1PHL8_9EUKA|mmetsp:Transcript_4826/g.18039  ORF Transcript_4826/g.18039 Transcript_4826/m.18039 type:complete len:505 (+) Transcript_4826:169-1683(+)
MTRFGSSIQRPDPNTYPTSPGPIYYVREFIGKDSKKISFTKGQRAELYEGFDSPLGKYAIHQPDPITPQIKFSGAPRFQEELQRKIDPVGTPGPMDTSNLSAFQFHSSQPTYSFQGRPKEVAQYMGKLLSVPRVDAPPPGLYFNEKAEMAMSKVKRVKDVSFPRAKRDVAQKGTPLETPGPIYEQNISVHNSRVKRYPTAHFGTSTRPPLYNLYAREFPGPSYNPSFKLVYKQDPQPAPWSKSKTPKDPTASSVKKPAGPTMGPGQYNWDKTAPRVKNIRLLGKWKDRKKAIDGPDMTKYSKRTIVGGETPQISFSREGTSTDSLSKPNIKLSGKGYKRMYQGKALQTQDPDPDIPSVGAYTPKYDSLQLSHNKRVPGVSFGAPRTSSKRRPGTSASDRSSIGSKASRRHSEGRPSTALSSRSRKDGRLSTGPAPGDYNVIPGLRSLSQSRRVSGGKWVPSQHSDKGTPKPGLDSPGPKYNPQRDRFYETLMSSTKGTRFGGLQ